MVADDDEKKLPTSGEELPTSDNGEQNEKEPPETVIIDYGGGIIVHTRRPDSSLDEGHMWPIAFALKELTAAEESRIGALVNKAVS